VPSGSALERRSRTTYRPTVTPEGSTHVETFTGTTSSFSGTASDNVAVSPWSANGFCGGSGAAAKATDKSITERRRPSRRAGGGRTEGDSYFAELGLLRFLALKRAFFW
jgi:hypothetical protein